MECMNWKFGKTKISVRKWTYTNVTDDTRIFPTCPRPVYTWTALDYLSTGVDDFCVLNTVWLSSLIGSEFVDH